MIYLYGKGKRFEIVKDLLKQNRVKQKIIAIDKNIKSKKNVFNEEYFLSNYKYKNDYLIITVSNPEKRFSIYNRLKNKIKIRLHPPLVSKSAVLKKNVKIKNGSVIMDNVYIGNNVNINLNSTIGISSIISHDSFLDEYSEISHKVKIAGNVKIGKCCYLGIGSIVIQKIKIKDNSFIGAGVLVKKNLIKKSRITLKQKLIFK